jgi:monoamine oxidase
MSSANHNNYDIIIIGAGIAGLYSAYNIKKMSPNTKYLILEQNKKKYIGGRIGEDTFYGATTVSGAGIGRNDTNPILKKLMKELDVPFQKSTSIMDYSKLLQYSKEYDVVKIIDLLHLWTFKTPTLF